MYKVLIAEDTSLIRRGIISMLHWEQHSCVLAGEAENGKDAIKMLESLSPDILLLDVKMPHLDGMRVLDYVTERKINVKVIMISGYSNFEYVKHALQSNTVDYILKPIHEEELNQAVAKAVELLSCGNSNRFVSPVGPREQDFITLLEENVYSTFGDILETIHDDRLDKQLLFWVASLKNKYNDYTFFKERIKMILPNTLHVLFHEHADRMDIIFYSTIKEDHTVCQDIIRRIYALSDSLLKNLLYIGLSDVHGSDYIVTKAYYEAHKALCNKMLHPDQYLLVYLDFYHKNYCLEDVFQAENSLLDFLLSGNHTGAVLLCQKIIEEHLNKELISLDEFCMLLTEFYCTLLKTNTDYVSELQQEISALHNLENLLYYDDYKPLTETLYKYCTLITEEIISRRVDIDTSIFEIKKYIEQHFSEPITLKSLESLFHLNSSYISVTFKRITNIGINKYIRQLRMDYAIKLLSTTDFKMTDVCEKSGFTNYVHFSKEFKKYTGVSPSDYRLSLKGTKTDNTIS